jgi:hypothetical protein
MGTLGDGADATVLIAGACLAPDPASRTGDGLTGAGDDKGDAGVRVGRASADEGAPEPGDRPSAAWRAGPGDTLIRMLTAVTTAANTATPASTVMDERKLVSSMREYMTSRKADSLASRGGPSRRPRVRRR